MKSPEHMTFSTLVAAALLTTTASTQSFFVDRIEFSTQNGAPTNKWLTNWNGDYGSDAGSLYIPNGFAGGDIFPTPTASPVAVFGGAKIRMNLGLYCSPAYDDSFNAFGFVGANQISFYNGYTGLDPTDYVASTDAIIPSKVDVVPDWMSNWNAVGDSGRPAYQWVAPAHNKMYVTWAKPIASLYVPTVNTATLRRMDYVCNAAKGATSLLGAADMVWNVIADQAMTTNYKAQPGKQIVPYGDNDWKILDGTYSGECDEQARLMHRALAVLGIASEVKLMRASLDLADVFNVERRNDLIDPATGLMRPAYLMMDFNTSGAGSPAWNSFEALCVVPGRHYAVWDKYKANTAAEVFTAFPFRQFWVFTTENKEPGALLSDGVHYAFFEKIADPNPAAKPTS